MIKSKLECKEFFSLHSFCAISNNYILKYIVSAKVTDWALDKELNTIY